MEARLVEALPQEPGWQFEPKWDGFRCLVFRTRQGITLQSRSGKPLTRYFPEVLERVQAIGKADFVLDGELAVPEGDSLSFDALQARLHPAESRIRRLARETPARLMLFDMLQAEDGRILLGEPLSTRRAALESFHASLAADLGFVLTPYTLERRIAQRWLEHTGGSLDGVIAKAREGAYVPGERAMLKVKRLRTADCVVGGFRYARRSREVGSLLLGLYNARGELDHVGFTASLSRAGRRELTRQLEALAGGPGFTGSAPGGPSRWSTERSSEWQPIRPVLVAEVCYDHVSGDRFRHGTRFLRWRPDKDPGECTSAQLTREARPARLVAELLQAAAPRSRDSALRNPRAHP